MSTLPPINEDQEAQLRSRMLKRLAVAGAMVLILLGVLAFFDYLSTPEDNDAKVFSKPVPVPPKKEMTQPVKPNAELPEPPKPEQTPAKAEDKPAPVAEPPAKPEVSAQPAVPEAALGKAPAKATPIRPAPQEKAAETARPQPSGKPEPLPVPEGTAAPTGRPAESTAPTRPAAEAAASRPVPETVAQPRPAQPVLAAPPPLPRLLRGYVVQAGVFNNARAAEELHAKLALNGIPSTLEARVQIGPFKTKAEADAAQEKLKALGIEGLLIPPAGGRK